jgi:hypothetical protein
MQMGRLRLCGTGEKSKWNAQNHLLWMLTDRRLFLLSDGPATRCPDDGTVPFFSASELAPSYHDGATGAVLGCPHYARACKFWLVNQFVETWRLRNRCSLVSLLRQANCATQNLGGFTRVAYVVHRNVNCQRKTRMNHWIDTL